MSQCFAVRSFVSLLCLLVLAACDDSSGGDDGTPPPVVRKENVPAKVSPQASLIEVRGDFETRLITRQSDDEPLDTPPASEFEIVSYPGPLGDMAAYLSVPGEDQSTGKPAPAIIWLTGGFPVGGGGSYLWEEIDPENDQSARSYRDAGLVMMFPALRGAAGNPGHQESFFGEVDDVLAALDYLKGVDRVDPDRIYLGGHSTGGTLALLVAAATDEFAGVIAFGPVAYPANYGEEPLHYSINDAHEDDLRAPAEHLQRIKSPTFVIEGDRRGNRASLEHMQSTRSRPPLHYYILKNADHFSVLRPINDFIAQTIVNSDGSPIELDQETMQEALFAFQRKAREEQHELALQQFRDAGIDVDREQTVSFYLLVDLDKNVGMTARNLGYHLNFQVSEPRQVETRSGDRVWLLQLDSDFVPADLDAFAERSRVMNMYDTDPAVTYDGWLIQRPEPSTQPDGSATSQPQDD